MLQYLRIQLRSSAGQSSIFLVDLHLNCYIAGWDLKITNLGSNIACSVFSLSHFMVGRGLGTVCPFPPKQF